MNCYPLNEALKFTTGKTIVIPCIEGGKCRISWNQEYEGDRCPIVGSLSVKLAGEEHLLCVPICKLAGYRDDHYGFAMALTSAFGWKLVSHDDLDRLIREHYLDLIRNPDLCSTVWAELIKWKVISYGHGKGYWFLRG